MARENSRFIIVITNPRACASPLDSFLWRLQEFGSCGFLQLRSAQRRFAQAWEDNVKTFAISDENGDNRLSPPGIYIAQLTRMNPRNARELSRTNMTWLGESATEVSKCEGVLIMGASGRYFHTFNVCFRDDPAYDVIAFTAAPTWRTAWQLLRSLRRIGRHVKK